MATLLYQKVAHHLKQNLRWVSGYKKQFILKYDNILEQFNNFTVYMRWWVGCPSLLQKLAELNP